jgi:hypothetical protein
LKVPGEKLELLTRSGDNGTKIGERQYRKERHVNYPAVTVSVRFLTSEEGGRTSATSPDKLHCMFDLHGKYHDCRLLLDSVGSVLPGQTVTAPLIFLDPEFVIPQLDVGLNFNLRDPRLIATGTVIKIE